MDVYGLALQEYFTGNRKEKLWLYNNYGEPEEMPLDVFFRQEDEMPEPELYALELCEGSVLDIGAGAGSHAVLLQSMGLDVTALEISEGACKIMEQRGIDKIINGDIFNYKEQKFDTLLLLMNGIGLTGNLQRFREFLDHAEQLLNPGGQLIFDSSDISYLYHTVPEPKDKYFGEISYCYRYKTNRGEWFNWLYIDPKTLLKEIKETEWTAQIVYEDETGHYLARLTI